MYVYLLIHPVGHTQTLRMSLRGKRRRFEGLVSLNSDLSKNWGKEVLDVINWWFGTIKVGVSYKDMKDR